MIKNLKNNFPRITLITPSYNQGAFIEKTIHSVIDQGYPNLEYIVMDGGSSDDTLHILEKYKKHLTYVSKKDNGQSDAINRGMRRSSGDIFGFINSDDYLTKDSLQKVALFFMHNSNAFWMSGKCRIVDEKNREVRRFITGYKNILLKYLRYKTLFYIIQYISQPATFWRKEILTDIGLFDENLQYDMDLDYWIRIWQKFDLYYLDDYLAYYRVHTHSKAVSSPETQFQVSSQILRKYTDSKLILGLHTIHDTLALNVYRHIYMRGK